LFECRRKAVVRETQLNKISAPRAEQTPKGNLLIYLVQSSHTCILCRRAVNAMPHKKTASHWYTSYRKWFAYNLAIRKADFCRKIETLKGNRNEDRFALTNILLSDSEQQQNLIKISEIKFGRLSFAEVFRLLSSGRDLGIWNTQKICRY
jgi:hypothetical protein